MTPKDTPCLGWGCAGPSCLSLLFMYICPCVCASCMHKCMDTWGSPLGVFLNPASPF